MTKIYRIQILSHSERSEESISRHSEVLAEESLRDVSLNAQHDMYFRHSSPLAQNDAWQRFFKLTQHDIGI